MGPVEIKICQFSPHLYYIQCLITIQLLCGPTVCEDLQLSGYYSTGTHILQGPISPGFSE